LKALSLLSSTKRESIPRPISISKIPAEPAYLFAGSANAVKNGTIKSDRNIAKEIK